MTQQFRSYSDVQAVNDFGQMFSVQNYSATLAATTDTTLTVPGGTVMGALQSYNIDTITNGKTRVRAVIRCSAAQNVWMAINATAAVPAGGTFASTTSELINGQYQVARDVVAGDVLHFFTAASNVVVSVSFYSLAV